MKASNIVDFENCLETFYESLETDEWKKFQEDFDSSEGEDGDFKLVDEGTTALNVIHLIMQVT